MKTGPKRLSHLPTAIQAKAKKKQHNKPSKYISYFFKGIHNFAPQSYQIF
jgi:hypothetical protein